VEGVSVASRRVDAVAAGCAVSLALYGVLGLASGGARAPYDVEFVYVVGGSLLAGGLVTGMFLCRGRRRPSVVTIILCSPALYIVGLSLIGIAARGAFEAFNDAVLRVAALGVVLSLAGTVVGVNLSLLRHAP